MKFKTLEVKQMWLLERAMEGHGNGLPNEDKCVEWII